MNILTRLKEVGLDKYYNEDEKYFRYDTDDNTVKENEETYFDFVEDMARVGLEFVEPYIEHDCISGEIKITEEIMKFDRDNVLKTYRFLKEFNQSGKAQQIQTLFSSAEYTSVMQLCTGYQEQRIDEYNTVQVPVYNTPVMVALMSYLADTTSVEMIEEGTTRIDTFPKYKTYYDIFKLIEAQDMGFLNTYFDMNSYPIQDLVQTFNELKSYTTEQLEIVKSSSLSVANYEILYKYQNNIEPVIKHIGIVNKALEAEDGFNLTNCSINTANDIPKNKLYNTNNASHNLPDILNYLFWQVKRKYIKLTVVAKGAISFLVYNGVDNTEDVIDYETIAKEAEQLLVSYKGELEIAASQLDKTVQEFSDNPITDLITLAKYQSKAEEILDTVEKITGMCVGDIT